MIFAVGPMVQIAMQAAIELTGKGISAGVIDARFVKPMDGELLAHASRARLVVTLEDNVLSGGFGQGVAAFFADADLRPDLLNLGLPDRYVEHAGVDQQLRACGLDAISVAERVLRRLGGNP